MATNKSTRPNGYILHEDAVRVVIATGINRASANAKTGGMIQVYILAKAENPVEAIRTGLDAVICGDCPLRGINGKKRTCYVNVGQGPLAIWKAWQRGNYPVLTDYSVFDGRRVRLGAYGDPAFMPVPVIAEIVRRAKKHTGYTHQWSKPLFAGLRPFVMASVESPADAAIAQGLGWRTFRVMATRFKGDIGNGATATNELVCLSDARDISCAQCGLCNGASTAKSILIAVHGSGAKHLPVAA